jgi:hypothetical protein
MYIFRGSKWFRWENGYCRYPRGFIHKGPDDSKLESGVLTRDVRLRSHKVKDIDKMTSKRTQARLSRGRVQQVEICTYSSGTSSSAVPVGNGVAEALTNSDTLVSHISDGLEHVLGQVVGSLLVDVVLDVKPLGTSGSSGTALGDITVEPVLGVLDLSRRVLVVVIGVNVEVDDVVTKCCHISLALTSAAGIRWAHVGGNFANNVAESHLVLPHLLLAVEGRDGAQVQVGPGVRSKLVTLGIHTLEDIDKLGGDVDLALVDVVARDEESSLCVILLHQVQNVRSKDLLWAIVVCQSNCAWLNTAVDSLATILDRSNLGTCNGGSVGARRSCVLGAARAVLVVTARGVAEVVISATV